MADRLILGTRKGTILLDRAQGRFKARPVAHAGVPIAYAARDPRTGTLWASLDHGHWGCKLARSDDDGATWNDATQIKYPEGARYYEFNIFEAAPGEEPKAKVRDATLLKNWVIAFGNADQPGRVYVGTIPGGLFVSDDNGETWDLNRPLWNHESRGGDLFKGEGAGKSQWFGTPAAVGTGEFAPGIHSIVVDPRDGNRILVAVSSAGVIETTNGGKTWQGRNKGMTVTFQPDATPEWGHDPHFVALCPGAPDHVWQQNHCGIFYSDNGAKEWRGVSKDGDLAHFGFPVAADAKDGKTAWVVPARGDDRRMSIDGGLCVCRTQDGGQSWEALREGLPQESAHDVVYRHALDISGDSLAFGSTTGNLYLSDDRGESWKCLGNNFPPIHSVRFG